MAFAFVRLRAKTSAPCRYRGFLLRSDIRRIRTFFRVRSTWQTAISLPKAAMKVARLQPASPAYSRPVMFRITSIVRRSPAPAPAAWRRLTPKNIWKNSATEFQASRQEGDTKSHEAGPLAWYLFALRV